MNLMVCQFEGGRAALDGDATYATCHDGHVRNMVGTALLCGSVGTNRLLPITNASAQPTRWTMETDSFKLAATFPVSARELYEAWLDSKKHAALTGAGARIGAKVGNKFSAWDGYIQGKTLELVPFQRIVQAWRTTDFPAECDDSIVEVTLQDIDGGCRMTIRHTSIPKGQGDDYKEGWRQFYFKPMREYFRRQRKQ